MNVGLFIPCYIDQFFPHVGIATLELLTRFGCEVAYPPSQTCCGQPLANAGYERRAAAAMRQHVEAFRTFEYVVVPSGSCAYHVRHHFDSIGQTDDVRRVRQATYELCEFLVDVLGVTDVGAVFPHRVGLHESCHGLRGLRLGPSSELVETRRHAVRMLLENVEALELVTLDRRDECCGFGGTFAVTEEAVSVLMGEDRLDDHERNGAHVITSTDMSCLMHMDGLARRAGRNLRVVHIAEILNGGKR